MERKIVEYFEIVFCLSIGIILVYLFDFMNTYSIQLLFSKFYQNFLSLFFYEVYLENEKIYLNKIEFVFSKDCIKLSSFLLILPFLLLRRKIKLILLIFILFNFQNILRINFEIFLIINFNIDLDFLLYNFQNIFQPLLFYFLLTYYKSSFKLSNKRIFNFF